MLKASIHGTRLYAEPCHLRIPGMHRLLHVAISEGIPESLTERKWNVFMIKNPAVRTNHASFSCMVIMKCNDCSLIYKGIIAMVLKATMRGITPNAPPEPESRNSKIERR